MPTKTPTSKPLVVTRPKLSPENARAIVTTKWTKNGYRPVTVRSIESYSIESNLDQDSDNFSIVIGDPRNVLGASLNRDSEVRCQIFGIGKDVRYLLTGLADDIDFTQENVLTITGRDMSCIATDTFANPGAWRHTRPSDFIRKRATALKMTSRFALAPTPVFTKFNTDGSETEWELWYRLIREKSQFIWLDSDGTLRSGPLNYAQAPSYFFGSPPISASSAEMRRWIPIETAAYKKTTQQRVGTVVLFYHTKKKLQVVQAEDPTTREWLKRPLKFIESQKIHRPESAKKKVWDEIYESKVGALEIRITIPDIGVIIQQNRMARIRIPELDLHGDWFIVGTRIIADETGFTQEIRLREKGYAISKKIPDDPEVTTEPRNPSEGDCPGISDLAPWIDSFYRAALKWRGNKEFAFFLAVLLGICEQETGFKNERSHGPPGVDGATYFVWDGNPQQGITTKHEWELSFANEGGDGLVNADRAVGPMQLYDTPLKQEADRYDVNGGTGKVDELLGNRWVPDSNIWVAGHKMNSLMNNLHVNDVNNDSIWPAVKAYNGSGPAADAYMAQVKQKVMGPGGWYERVKEALKACQEWEVAPPENVPDLAASEAAKRILQYWKDGKFRDDHCGTTGCRGAIIDQLEATAAGQTVHSQCGDDIYIKADPLNGLLTLLDAGWLVGAFALCSDHSCNVADSDPPRRSAHSDGRAVDVSSLGNGLVQWNVIGNCTATTKNLVISAMKLFKGLSESDRPDQMICNGSCDGHFDPTIQALQLNNHQPTDYITGDHTDHIHLGY